MRTSAPRSARADSAEVNGASAPAVYVTAAALPISVRISDALVELFGSHPGFREIHAKGIVCSGTFAPSAEAASISRAEHFRRTVPVTVRFSDFAGIPTIPSTDPNASPHGLAIKFHAGAEDTDIVAHSVDAFPAATGEEFLRFIEALTATESRPGEQAMIDTYLASHPAAMHFVTAMPSPPVSYATSAYYAINAFAFSNTLRQVVYGRYQLQPEAGVHALDPGVVSVQPANYLADEITARLRDAPVRFSLALQIAGIGDATNDGTKAWPADRYVAELGTLTIANIVPNSLKAERSLIYDPARLIDGIALSDDPLPAVRSAVYAISVARRSRS